MSGQALNRPAIEDGKTPGEAARSGRVGWVADWTWAESSFVGRFLYLGLLLSLIYVFAFDGLIRLLTGSSQVTLLRDLLPWTFSLIGVLYLTVSAKSLRLRQPLFGLIFLFVAIVVVEVWNPDAVSIPKAVEALRPHLEFLPLFFLGFSVIRSTRRLRGLALVLIVTASANGIVSTVQGGLSQSQLGSWGPGYEQLVNPNAAGGQPQNAAVFVNSQGENQVRPPGLGSDVGFGGVLGDVSLPFALALLLAARRRLDRLLGLVAVPLIALGILTSETRDAVVGGVIVIAAFLVLTAVRQRARAAPGIIVLAIVIGAVVFSGISLGRYSTITPSRLLSTFSNQRGGSISSIPTYARDYPFGAGLGTAGPATGIHASVNSGKLSGENLFDFLIVELGVPGLVVVLALFGSALRRGRRLATSRALPPEARIYLTAFTAALFGCAVQSLSGAVTATPPLSPFIWLAFGVLAGWSVWAPPPRLRVLPTA